MEIALLVHDLSGGCLILPIAQHQVGTAHEDLAVDRQFQEGLAIPFVHDRMPYGAGLHFAMTIEGQDGARFCQPVAFVDGDSQGPKELVHLGVQGGSPGDGQADPSAGANSDLGEHQPVREEGQDTQHQTGSLAAEVASGQAVPHLHGPTQHRPFQQSPSHGRIPHARVNLLEDPGYGQENFGLGFLEILGDGHVVLAVVDRYPAVEHDVVPRHALVDMGKRQHAQAALSFAGLQDPQHRVEVGDQIPVAQHGALGVPGGSGGVDDGEEIPWQALRAPSPDFRPAGFHGRAQGDELLPLQYLASGLGFGLSA